MIEAVVGVALRAILASVLLGGLLAALVLVATRTLALTAATRHALWTTALLATALMPLAGIGMSVLKGAPPQAAHFLRDAWSPRSELATNIRPVHDSTALAPSPPSQPQTTRVTAPAAPTTPSFVDRLALADRLAFAAWTPRVSRTIALGIVGGWALGALIGLIGLGASVARVRGLKRRSSPLEGDLADELPWLTEAGPGREIYLRLSYETETPVAIGFRRPVILIPTELATADGLAAIESLILHEYAHLRRNDDWTNLLQRAIERVFWFNPIVWLLGRRIALEREIASDDAVVEKTGEAHAYATSLWKLVREMRMPEHAVVAPGALLTRKQITVRIEQLLDKKRTRLHRSPLAALGVALAGVFSVAFVATSAPAVELPAQAAEVTAKNDARPVVAARHRARAEHGRLTTAPGKIALNRAATGTTVWAQNALSIAASASDARTKTVQAQLEVLRKELAAAKKSPRVIHEKTVQIVERAPQVAAPASSSHDIRSWGDMPSAVREIPAVPARPVLPALPPLPVVAPSAAARSRYAAEIERTIKAAMESIPREVAIEINGSHPRFSGAIARRLDGMKLTRAMIASCTACSFRNADARGLDLHDLKLSADDFSGADMRGVNLAGAKLSGVSLARANLANADLRGTLLSGVELSNANFDGARLEGIRLTGVSVRRLSVRGTSLRSVVANCSGCEFSGADLHGQDLHGLTLTGADFTHADLHDANLSGVHFFSVDLSHANLNGADLTNALLETCDLDGADLRNARTTGMTTHTGELDG